jgi:hypothetical protein
MPDRCHLDDLAVDQLEPLILAEDAELDHPLVLVSRESPRPLDVSRHDGAPT